MIWEVTRCGKFFGRNFMLQKQSSLFLLYFGHASVSCIARSFQELLKYQLWTITDQSIHRYISRYIFFLYCLPATPGKTRDGLKPADLNQDWNYEFNSIIFISKVLARLLSVRVRYISDNRQFRFFAMSWETSVPTLFCCYKKLSEIPRPEVSEIFRSFYSQWGENKYGPWGFLTLIFTCLRQGI